MASNIQTEELKLPFEHELQEDYQGRLRSETLELLSTLKTRLRTLSDGGLSPEAFAKVQDFNQSVQAAEAVLENTWSYFH